MKDAPLFFCGVLLAVFASPIVGAFELWPLSPYPMFAYRTNARPKPSFYLAKKQSPEQRLELSTSPSLDLQLWHIFSPGIDHALSTNDRIRAERLIQSVLAATSPGLKGEEVVLVVAYYARNPGRAFEEQRVVFPLRENFFPEVKSFVSKIPPFPER